MATRVYIFFAKPSPNAPRAILNLDRLPVGKIYSCFEKGCLTNGEKLTRQCRKVLWVMVVFTVP